MGTKRVGPEAKIIALFTALPEDSQRIVMEIIRSQIVSPRNARKVAAKKVKKPTPVVFPDTENYQQKGTAA